MERHVNSLFRRIVSLALCAVMLVSLLPVSAIATELKEVPLKTEAVETETVEAETAETEASAEDSAETPDETESEGVPFTLDRNGETPLAVVYAASDFQPSDDKTGVSTTGKAPMNNITGQMISAGYAKDSAFAVTGALIVGDYSNHYDTWTDINVNYNNTGLAAVAGILQSKWGLTSSLNELSNLQSKDNAGDDVIYVQGNHDPAETKGLDSFGDNDTAHYGVFVIHEDYFQWYQKGTGDGNDSLGVSAEDAAKTTAEALRTYLQNKVDTKDNRPIFVASHVPLHFGWRTYASNKYGDNIYAKYLFDVLNEYGKELNIIFLFGHNHSNTYDDYLGGAAVYLPAGDKLRVPDLGSTTNSTEYTLNFTYMNAGYLGYYGGKCETKLSSTVFAIYSNEVVVARYDEDGAANLKDAGIKSGNDTWTGAAANTTVYTNSSEKAVIKLKTFKEELRSPALSSGIMTTGNSTTVSVGGLYGKTYAVEWSSSDPAIAEVAASATNPMTATITAKGAGKVRIYAKLTEVSNTRAVGDTQTLTMELDVLDVAVVTLAAAGNHSYYILDSNQDSSSWTADTSKKYVLVSQEKGNPAAGQFMAMYYNAQVDAAEGDDAGEAAWRELNAEPITVMQLPINGQLLYAVTTSNTGFLWNFTVADMSDNYNWYRVGPVAYTDRSLMLSKGHTEADLQKYDPDNDGIRLRGNSNTHGSVWRMSNRGAGLTSMRTYNSVNYYFAPYYDSIQGDISVYYTQNGDENMGQRIYVYKETTVNLTNPIVAYMKDTSGSVSMGVGLDAGTGDVIYIQNGEQVVTVPVTLSMLSGTFNKDAAGTYSDLTVTYAGKPIVTDYTLTVNKASTLLKNEGGKFRSTIYRLVDEMVGGRHYMIVDAAEAGEAHAMGANPDQTIKSGYATATASAHNVLIQSFAVGGQSGLYIDSTRYSNEPDNPTDSIIVDQGNVSANIFSAAHKAAIRLVWTPSIIHTTPSFSSNAFYNIYCGDTAYRILISEYQDGRLWIDGDRPILYWGGSNDAYERWKYVPTGSSDHMQEGLVLDSGIVDNFRLFYAAETHIDREIYGNNATNTYQQKNFIVEGTASSPYAPLTRRTWLYEQVDNIDTITARLSGQVGAVTTNSNASAPTGAYILVETFLTDGTVETVKVPLRVSMLSGTYNLNAKGTYENLTVTYQGKVISSSYTLTVADVVPNDYPEFPDEGAVRIDKQLDTTKFNYLETGAASIDLSVTGIPAQSGVDILFVLDTSSSMRRCIHHIENGKTCGTCGTVTDANSRLSLLKQTLVQTLKDLQAPIDGYAPDIDVAVACFNGYTPINTDIFLDYTKAVSGDSATNEDLATEFARKRMDSSTVSLNFTDIGKLTETAMQAAADGLYVNAGTNYDRGMEIAYSMLKAKQEQSASNGETRQQILVFMSDGIPYQFNYTHGTPWMVDWNNYLMGNTVAAVPADAGARKLFDEYRNENETLWMAEAIKGNPNQKYKIINPDLQDSTTKIDYVNGLGATIYTVGMGIFGEERVSAEAANLVLRNIASPEKDGKNYFYSCTEPDGFKGAFSDISKTIRQAGDAVFKDQMGPDFDLITSNKITWNQKQSDGTEVTNTLTFTPAPTIVVKEYELYKRSEIGTTLTFTITAEDGSTSTRSVTVTETMVGSRKPVEPHIIETVTFNDDGTAAYSTMDVDGDGKTGTADNILEGKVIHAATFWYNTDTTGAQMIDTDGDSKAETSLEKECFYWNVGDIPQDERVLTYDVYLTGSMEGTRPAGNYNTNTFAKLNYENYLNHPCELKVPTPKLPWNQATVGFGFYLVDEYGNPIINQSTGQIGSFERSVRITQPVYEDFLLNSGSNDIVANIRANGTLPEGYELYDDGAAYSVSLHSNGTGFYIVYTDEATGTQTTYVVGVDSTPVTADPTGAFDQTQQDFAGMGQKTETDDFATANTIVWFAVVATVKCVPDTVVVDFGLPVNIDVLSNDMLIGNYGTLTHINNAAIITETDAYKAELAKDSNLKLWKYLQNLKDHSAKFETISADGAYGKLTLVDNGSTGEVCYTLNTANGMQMNKEETFVYGVNYTGSVGTQGYYYSTVTVIPATTIYYEDSFVSYSAWNVSDDKLNTDSGKQWASTTGTVNKDQAQDRPGEYSFPEVDANNIYGYDGAYTNMVTHSLGSAMKFTANNEVYGEAQFTFWGTGFDVVSLTSNTTGTITVDVYKTSDFAQNGYFADSDTYMVDTYYGYKYALCNVTYEYEVHPNTEKGEWTKLVNGLAAEDATEQKADLDSVAKPEDGDRVNGVEYAWIVDPTANNTLYQVPVMKVNGLTYDQYTAVITVHYRPGLDHNKADASYDFYLDAIRIYDPANDGKNNATIENAYKADGEGWPEYFELRNLIISEKDFDALTEGAQTSGIVFIDNTLDTENNISYSISDYTNYGPNNELYLAPGKGSAPGQAVVFDLAIPGDVAGIHLAMKSVGGTAKVAVYDAADSTHKSVTPTTIATATDLYYDITSLNNKTVVIANMGGTGDANLSITNIKVTYKSQHTDSIEADWFRTTVSGTQKATTSLMMMRPPVEPEVPVEPEIPVEPDVPVEPEEPEVFEPEKFNVRLSDSSVKVGSKVTVTVTTGADVDYITVNGTKVTKYTGSWFSSNRTWLARVETEEVGQMDVAVVCYNSDDLASESVVENITVTQQYTSLTNVVKDLISGIFGRLWGSK